MLTLYTAVGILRFQDSIKEHKTPTVINNRQEYGLTEEEFFLWSSLAFQIRQIHELQSAFSERLKKHHRSENIPIEPYLNRLLLRGLVVKGDGLTGVDPLFLISCFHSVLCNNENVPSILLSTFSFTDYKYL